MDAEALLQKAIELIEDRKAVDLRVFDVRGRSILADYYLICSGNSSTQIRAIASNLDRGLRALEVPPRSIEGKPESLWVLLDFRDLLIHVFHPDTRQYYNLDGLMDGAPCIYPPQQPVAPVAKALASDAVAAETAFEVAAGASPLRAERVLKTRRRRKPE